MYLIVLFFLVRWMLIYPRTTALVVVLVYLWRRERRHAIPFR